MRCPWQVFPSLLKGECGSSENYQPYLTIDSCNSSTPSSKIMNTPLDAALLKDLEDIFPDMLYFGRNTLLVNQIVMRYSSMVKRSLFISKLRIV